MKIQVVSITAFILLIGKGLSNPIPIKDTSVTSLVTSNTTAADCVPKFVRPLLWRPPTPRFSTGIQGKTLHVYIIPEPI